MGSAPIDWRRGGVRTPGRPEVGKRETGSSGGRGGGNGERGRDMDMEDDNGTY